MQFYASVSKMSGIDWHTLRKKYSLLQMIAIAEAYTELNKQAEEQMNIPQYKKNFRSKLNILRKAEVAHTKRTKK